MVVAASVGRDADDAVESFAAAGASDGVDGRGRSVGETDPDTPLTSEVAGDNGHTKLSGSPNDV